MGSEIVESVDRLERFRALRARLDPAGDPAKALNDGAYVDQRGAVSARLAAELEIAPTSMQLVIGGVGSGKTTELLKTQDRLNRLPDTLAFYIDVSKRHDVATLAPGVVVVQVALAIGEWAKSNIVSDDDKKVLAGCLRRLGGLAQGYKYEPDYFGDEDGDWVHRPGLLVPPDKLDEDVREILEHLDSMLEIVRPHKKHIVVLLDGLDRLMNMQSLEQLVENDIKALKIAGIGCALVGPLRAQYGMDRTIVQRFDNMYYQPWRDPASADNQAFLQDVLRKRMPMDAMDQQGLEAIVHHSGGVLRDLLSLAQSACLEAYMGGSDVIGLWEADTAIDSFGRKHMQGLRPNELTILHRVVSDGSFVHTSEDELALLMTRRVLEYRVSGRPKYAVHPTIVNFLLEPAEVGG